MASYFLWLKAFHIIAVICWFAGLFYMPRLFVYHAMSQDDISIERFRVMERKLYRGIMWPSLVATWLLGIWMISLNASYYFSQPWLHIKLTLVILLTGYHVLCGYYRKQLLENNSKSHVFFRWFNEVPVIILIIICVLVVVKPQL